MGSAFAAKTASWLFLAAGVLTIVNADMPGSENAVILRVIGGCSLLIGMLARVLPWDRWSPSWPLVLVVPAFAMMAIGNRYGGSSPYDYAVYFVVLFTWVGLTQPRRTSLWLAPVATLFYLAPIVTGAKVYPGAGVSAVIAISVCVLVGETVAWATDELRVARKEADHRASL